MNHPGPVLTGLLMLMAASATADAAPPAARPNIVVVIADDWSFPHAGAYGDRVVKTPNFDRLAREGVRFTRSYCAVPSCTASRGALLTGQAAHRLESGADLWSHLPKKFTTYPEALESAGYAIGLTGKGWGPGSLEGTGRTRNPAGPQFRDFNAFLETVPAGTPFCYWLGSVDPHRPYVKDTGVESGMDPKAVVVPPYFPDTPVVRADICDYYFEVQRFDQALGTVLKALDERGLAGDTLIVATSDNGMPFPRCKANLHDSGTHMPLAVRWPGRLPAGKAVDAFVSHVDLAPTFLQAAGLAPDRLPDMTGQSLLPLMEGRPNTPTGRDAVFLERERHAYSRAGNLSYPSRAVRTAKYLYIRNLRHDRWPAGDPLLVHSVGPFGDVDSSPTKHVVRTRRDDPKISPFFRLAFAKRPAEELYDLEADPHQLVNVVDQPAHAAARAELRARLDRWMAETDDPLAHDPGTGTDRVPFDDYPYVGPPEKNAPAASPVSGPASPTGVKPGR